MGLDRKMRNQLDITRTDIHILMTNLMGKDGKKMRTELVWERTSLVYATSTRLRLVIGHFANFSLDFVSCDWLGLVS